MAVVVLDEQGPGVLAQHGPQGTRACRAHRRTRRVLRAVRDDQGAGPGREDPAHVLGQRPLVVDPDGDRAQAEGGHQVEEAAPARILDGDGVPGLEMGGEDPLHRVQRAGRHRHGPVRHSVGVQSGAGDAGQFRIDGRLPVQHRFAVALLRRRGEHRPQGGQQGRVRVAVGQVAHPLGHLDADELPPGGGRPRSHPAAPPPGRLDDAPFAQGAVGGGDGVRIHSELLRQLPHRRQRLPRFQFSRAHRALDARGNLRCAPSRDPILS